MDAVLRTALQGENVYLGARRMPGLRVWALDRSAEAVLEAALPGGASHKALVTHTETPS